MATVAVNLGEDDGWAEVTISDVTKKLDVGRAHSTLFALQQQAAGPGRTHEVFYDHAGKFLVELGYPEPSHGMTLAFLQWLNGRMAERYPKTTPGGAEDAPEAETPV